MLTARIGRAFSGLYYWARLPGAAAFCGAAAGIGAARAVFAILPAFAPAYALLLVRMMLGVTILTAVAGILCQNRLLKAVLFAVCGVALFAGAELGIRDFYRRMEAVCERRQIFTLTVRISSPVAEAYSANRFRGRVIGADDAEAAAALTGKTLQFTLRGAVPPYGTVTVQGRYSAPRPAAGPFGFDQREHYAVNNIHGNFAVSRVINNENSSQKPQAAPISTKLSPDNVSYALRTTVHNVINKASNPDARAVFLAAFLGEKERLTPELNTSFRRSGIIHLLAISGFHAALLYSAVFAALGALAVPNRPRTFVSLAFLWGYLFFIGIIPSLFRATVMVSFFCLSTVIQRKNHAVHSLGVAGFFWLCLSPHSLFAPGFQLSFAATAGIIMLQPVLNGVTLAINESINSKPAEFLVNKALSPLWVSIAGFAATAPPLLHHFGTLSVFGIFFNLIAIPLMSAAMWLFFIAVVLSPVGFVSDILVWGAEKVLGVMIRLSDLGGGMSWSEIVVPQTSAPQIVVMVIFMAGLCAVRKNLRARFALRAGAAAFAFCAVTSICASIGASTENLEFSRNNATINVVIHKDNTAWIIAQGRKNDIRHLRTREIEPLLYRKGIRSVPLFLISEGAEEEAHEFAFCTDFYPHIVSLRPNIPHSGGTGSGDDDKRNAGYALINTSLLTAANGTCSLSINGDGRVEIVVR